MALDQSALLDLLAELKLTDVTDRIRSATETLYQELIDAEATAFIGAAPFERNVDRSALRNGTRPRTLTTTTGDLSLRIPKLRSGSFFPALLERRRRVDQALFAVVMEPGVITLGARLAGGFGCQRPVVGTLLVAVPVPLSPFLRFPLMPVGVGEKDLTGYQFLIAAEFRAG